MPLNTDKNAPQPCAAKARKAGNKQKSKPTSRKAKPVSATNSAPTIGSEGVSEEGKSEVMAHLAKAKEELKVLEAQKEALNKEITEVSTNATLTSKIERPRGVSIQEGMGLSNDKWMYDTIRHLVRDLIGEVGLNLELPWPQISAAKKAKLYQTACEELPFLKRFANDWPTQALAMQLMKNKRGHSYHRGYLEVPKKYTYLKDNAAKKKLQGGHATLCGSEEDSDINANKEDAGDLADTVTSTFASCSKSKRAAPVTAATQPRKKKKMAAADTLACSTAKSKGKQKASSIEAEAEEEEETQDCDIDNASMVDLEE